MITHVNIIRLGVAREERSIDGGRGGIRRSVFTCERLDHSSQQQQQHENNKEEEVEDAPLPPHSSSSIQSCYPLIIEYLLQSCL